MNKSNPKMFWRSPAERTREPDVYDIESSAGSVSAFSRRQFLEAAGFTMSMAAVSGCQRAATETALPFVVQPDGVIPGRMRQYASTCQGCTAACGLLVGVRDGRPLKMEGMPEHPLSRGGLCAIGQALPLGLYDNQRLRGPQADGQPQPWAAVDEAIGRRLAEAASQGAVVVVTPTVTSPTLQAAIDTFLASYDNARHVVFDTPSASAILDAHQDTHGVRALPHFHFGRAQVIVSFGADFLGTWISPVEFTAAWRSRRIPTPEQPEMSHHVQLEGRMSLTGSNADQRLRLAPDEFGTVLAHLATRLCRDAARPVPSGELPPCPLGDAQLDQLARRLEDARGQSLVISDSQDVVVQRLVNLINDTLGNYDITLDLKRPSRQCQANDADVIRLVDELKSGKVAALFVAGTDLSHNLPEQEEIGSAIAKVPLVVSMAERSDDFATRSHFVCPDHHPLESWRDAEPVSGVFSLTQPTLAPLHETRSLLESFSRWTGRTATAYEMLQAHWRQMIYPRLERQVPFQEFWDQTVHDGFVEVDTEPLAVSEFQADKVVLPVRTDSKLPFTLSLYHKVGLTDSRHAHNPWLQELPDPVTKVTWDNYVCVSSAVAEAHELSDGDLVRVATDSGATLDLPVFIQPGQHDRVLAIALAYGVLGTERFVDIGPQWLEARPTVAAGERVGKNAAVLRQIRSVGCQLDNIPVSLQKIAGRRELASTQEYHSLEIPRNVAPQGAEVRDIVQATTLGAFATDPSAGTPESHHHSESQLWAEDHAQTGHAWGMVVDLNTCTGCSACLIACQSENNVPVVGKDEVRRQREMHWIRIDRYYSGSDDDIQVTHQPLMCQHCDNAPCETVCPVLATVHGDEGLNEQVYNRCVGTRYCANNCPYKVRRFNWFRYDHDDLLQNLALNPDVTVRRRGVMEKCSMCVQRIEHAKIEARRTGQPLIDGTIKTACQQSCPAQAITFGDMNDPQSEVRVATDNPRRYRLLEEFNFRPSVAYLRVVKNRPDDVQPPASQRGEHHD